MPKAASTRKTKAKADGGKKAKKGMFNLSSHGSRQRLTFLADPNAPKRGLSAYMFFANEQRDKLRAEQPNLKFGTSHRLTTTILRVHS